MSLKLFFSYGRKEKERDAAKDIIDYLREIPSLEIFWDYKLEAGEDWKKRLLSEAASAKIFIYLLSKHSLREDSFCQIEWKTFRQHNPEGIVIPIYYQADEDLIVPEELKGLHSLPIDQNSGHRKHYTYWTGREKDACASVSLSIRKVVDKLIAQELEIIQATIRKAEAVAFKEKLKREAPPDQLFRTVLDDYLKRYRLRRVDLETFLLGGMLLDNYYRDKHIIFKECYIEEAQFMQQLADFKVTMQEDDPELYLLPFELYTIEQGDKLVLKKTQKEAFDTINLLRSIVDKYQLTHKVWVVSV